MNVCTDVNKERKGDKEKGEKRILSTYMEAKLFQKACLKLARGGSKISKDVKGEQLKKLEET